MCVCVCIFGCTALEGHSFPPPLPRGSRGRVPSAPTEHRGSTADLDYVCSEVACEQCASRGGRVVRWWCESNKKVPKVDRNGTCCCSRRGGGL